MNDTVDLARKPTPHEAEDAAFKLSAQLPTAELTRYLLETVGPRVTAASLGLADARMLRRWATTPNAEPRDQFMDVKLRALYRVVHAITAVFGAATAAGFLRSSNPQLDDDAPLLVLRAEAADEDAVQDQARRVLAAARAFLEG